MDLRHQSCAQGFQIANQVIAQIPSNWVKIGPKYNSKYYFSRKPNTQFQVLVPPPNSKPNSNYDFRNLLSYYLKLFSLHALPQIQTQCKQIQIQFLFLDLIVVINLLNSFRLYENLMMVLTRSALVSSSNSDGTVQLGGTCAVDHGLCSVCHGSQQTRDWIQCEKCSHWLHSQCLKIPKEVFVYLSSSENFSYFCDSCVSKKSAFDDSTENAKLDELRKDIKTIVENVIEEKLPNKIPISTKEPKTRVRHVPETTITEDKNYHYKIRISGIEEMDSKFFIDRQLHDKSEVENVLDDLNCSVNVIETQRLGKFDKNRTRNLLVTFGSVWDARTVIAKAIEKKFFLNKRVLITPELSPKDLLLEKQLLAKRYELIRSGIDRSRLKIKKIETLQRR